MTTETPTLHQELHRKLVDYLMNRETRRIAGEISPSVIGIECGALWDVLAGLIDKETAHLLAQLEAGAKRPFEKRYFFKPGKESALVLAHNPTETGWVLFSKGGDKPMALAHNKTDAGELRQQQMAAISQQLITKGYKEIT
ncbi:hypothetical protein ATN89_17115 [Comamonas thiooxydans]|uniref:hypothetical protein n=1 Tax=Comamonas thiooxydans TaxID=363952 RepID=UPI0007C525DE|nr:hypothetical protein [Comamonas thiooxydans]OAD82938.1 hypothetical protein ATN89_17115 [Comamonas thiooxydans]